MQLLKALGLLLGVATAAPAVSPRGLYIDIQVCLEQDYVWCIDTYFAAPYTCWTLQNSPSYQDMKSAIFPQGDDWNCSIFGTFNCTDSVPALGKGPIPNLITGHTPNVKSISCTYSGT